MPYVLRELTDRLSLLHEGGVAGDAVDWAAVAAEHGVALFPADYREFVEAFGAGSIEDSLFLWIPRLGSPAVPLTVGRLPETTVRSPSMGDWQDPGASARHRLEDMLVWGQTNSADVLCWATSDPDPNRWPVVVWERHGGGWKIYDCGVVEFILRLLQGNFSDCPLSDTSLWGVQSARFLNFRDEERLLDEGFDAWTGESMDPFGGLE
jgi:hypothetical protein